MPSLVLEQCLAALVTRSSKSHQNETTTYDKIYSCTIISFFIFLDAVSAGQMSLVCDSLHSFVLRKINYVTKL